ncbi:tail fibers protein [Lactococcus phage CHPC971]|uniref:Tail fibers protein n=1 Tax=Lactococcus phage CHPC971 TaxID=2575255 RepID=A0A4Y5N1A4_9CAUD|nr:distal tail protein Dit [Lactococcus phage CHPC971]QCW07621.1 tail fibers protein [Lactococcus phage CHPC971]
MTHDDTFDIFFGTDKPVNIGAMFDGVTVIGRDIGNTWNNTLVGGIGRYGSSFSFVNNESKKITVQFTKKLRQNEMALFREELAGKLDFPQGSQRLLFNDQPNRYYNANVDGNIGFQYDVKSGVGVGTITFLVPDGLAHSTFRKNITKNTIDPNVGSITFGNDGIITVDVNNEGNVEAYPTITIDNKVENDYINISTAVSTFQLGHKDDPSGKSLGKVSAKSIINIKQNDNSSTTGWGLFTPAGNMVSQSSADFYSNGGSLKYGSNHSLFGSGLIIDSEGSNPTQPGARWKGGFSKYTLPTAIQDFTLDFTAKYWESQMGQTGIIEIILVDENNIMIASYIMQKGDTSGDTSSAILRYNSNYPTDNRTDYKEFKFGANNNERGQSLPNVAFNSSKGQARISKKDQTLSWMYNGATYSVSSTLLATAKVKSIYIGIGGWMWKGRTGTIQVLTVNSLSLVQNNAIGLISAPNLYTIGSRNIINMYTGKFTYILDPKASTIGNNDIEQLVDGSEPFSIPKGKSQILIQGSQWADWVTNPPDISVSFEENFM